MLGRLRTSISVVLVSLLGGCGDSIDYDCSVFPPAESSSYILPWHVGQTYLANPHAARETSVQRYALDILMPIGTDVLAIRAGIVVGVEEDFVDGDNVLGHENYVFVQHEDGSVARYVHLTQMGALVEVSDVVQQGQPIGVSGHTGNSTEPHLHFDVTHSCCVVPPNYNELPFGETFPLTFRNARAERGRVPSQNSSCGLRKGVRYTAVPS